MTAKDRSANGTFRRIQCYVGQKFGRWSVVGDEVKLGHHYAYECECECGTRKIIRSYQLRSGKSLSCGCYRFERISETNTSHGMTNTPEFSSWSSMRERCYTNNRKDAASYYSKGITVCDRWRGKEGFTNFYKDMGKRPKGKTLDRIDCNGNYTPENCRWATPKEQSNNRSSNVRIEFEGSTYSAAELGKRFGVHPDTIRWRLKHWGNITSNKGAV